MLKINIFKLLMTFSLSTMVLCLDAMERQIPSLQDLCCDIIAKSSSTNVDLTQEIDPAHLQRLISLDEGIIASGLLTYRIRQKILEGSDASMQKITSKNEALSLMSCIAPDCFVTGATTVIKIWRREKNNCLCTQIIDKHASLVSSFAPLSPEHFASGSTDGTVIIWQLHEDGTYYQK